MFKVTLKKGAGKTYDVGGLVFKEEAPKMVNEKLGKYLLDNPCFSVEKEDVKKKEEDVKKGKKEE